MSPSLPPSLLAKLSPLCRWRGCERAKSPDADFCAEHHERMKGYWRRGQARRRSRLREARICRDCGGGLPKRWNSSRCRQCQRSQSAAARDARVKDARRRVQDTRSDPPAARGHYKTEVFADGAERTRYVGQSHRGGPTREEQDASAARIVTGVQAHAKTWLDERIEKQAEIDTLPRIQRAEGRQRQGDVLAYLGRLLIQAGADYGSRGAREMLGRLDLDEDE